MVNELSSAVTVWWTLSLLVHITVVPTVTAKVYGLKLKLVRLTFAIPGMEWPEARLRWQLCRFASRGAQQEGAPVGCALGFGPKLKSQLWVMAC